MSLSQQEADVPASPAPLRPIQLHSVAAARSSDPLNVYLTLLTPEYGTDRLSALLRSKELMYQQVLRRFGQFNCIRLTPPAPLDQLLLIALDEEEALGRWQPNDGPKEEIAKVGFGTLRCQAFKLPFLDSRVLEALRCRNVDPRTL